MSFAINCRLFNLETEEFMLRTFLRIKLNRSSSRIEKNRKIQTMQGRKWMRKFPNLKMWCLNWRNGLRISKTLLSKWNQLIRFMRKQIIFIKRRNICKHIKSVLCKHLQILNMSRWKVTSGYNWIVSQLPLSAVTLVFTIFVR